MDCYVVSSDPDEDTPGLSYVWNSTSAGDLSETSSTYTVLEADVDVGDTLTCTVTADDLPDSGTATLANTNTITIINSAPVGSASPTLSPSTIYEESDVTCDADLADYTDADGDDIELYYSWTVQDSSGTDQGSTETTNTLDSSELFELSLIHI